MMKPVILSLFALLFFTVVKAQSPIRESKDFSDLITSLQNEDWQNANRLSLSCLKKAPENDKDNVDAALLRYMFIYSEAGLMNDQKVSKSQALKNIINFKGQLIILPGHPVALKYALNTIQLVNNKTDSLFITATNRNGTDIFSFEYVILKDKWPIDDFKNQDGKAFRLGGIIKSLTVEGNFIPRFRIIIDQGTYQTMEN
jgi:hypothetical protein